MTETLTLELLWGLKLGQEVLVSRDQYGDVIDNSRTPADNTGKFPPIKAKIVGIVQKGTKKGCPIICAEKTKEWKGVEYNNSQYGKWCFTEYLTTEDINEKGFWHIYSDKVIETIGVVKTDTNDVCVNENEIKQVINKVNNNKGKGDTMSERGSFWDMVKSDAETAGYRVAATQLSKGTKAAILKLIESQGMDGNGIKAIEDILDSEFGAALISVGLGYGLTYMPKIGEDPRVEKLATEFRVGGMGAAGNVVAGIAMEHLLPVITGALASLPEEASTNARIAETSQSHEEQEEEQQQSKKEEKRATV